MRAEKFGASMGVLVEQIVHLITENYEYDEMTASNEFYSSKVYALLEPVSYTHLNRGMRAHRVVKGLDISEDVCHGMCP